MVQPDKCGVCQKVRNDNYILALRHPPRLSSLELWDWLGGQGHLVVNREHAADKKAVNNHDCNMILRLNRVWKCIDRAFALRY